MRRFGPPARLRGMIKEHIMATPTKTRFDWIDPFLLDQQLTDDERMVRDSAHAYCQEKLQLLFPWHVNMDYKKQV